MKKQPLVLFALIASACVAAYWAGIISRRPEAAPAPPAEQVVDGLAIETAALELGEVWEERDFSRVVRIRNVTKDPIVVDRFLVSCSACLNVDTQTVRVNPGETAEVKLKLDLTFRNLRDYGKPTRTLVTTFWPILESEGWAGTLKDKEAWTVRCTIKSRLTVDAQAIHLGETAVSGQESPPVKVAMTTHVPARSIEARADPGKVSVQIQRHESRPDRYVLSVAPNPELSPGRFQCEVALDLVLEDGQRVPGLVLPVTGEIQPAIRALPARLLLGARPVGAIAKETVVIQVPSGTTVQVERIETDSADLHIEAVTIPGSPPGRTFLVSQRIVHLGDQRVPVRFVLRRGGGETQTVAMEIAYRGEPADSIGLGAGWSQAP